MKCSVSSENGIIFLVVCTLTMVLISPAGSQVNRVTIFSSEDTYSSSSSPSLNFGDRTTLNLSRVEDNEIVHEDLIWLKFNLSDVPEGAVVTSTTLQLFCVNVIEPFNVSVHFCSDNSWRELALTFNNQPSFNETIMPVICETCGPENWALVDSSEQWYSWDVTFAVNQTVNGIFGGEGVTSIVLRENLNHSESVVALFNSREGSLGTRPSLKVAWSHIVPEFPSPIILLCILTILLLSVICVKTFHKSRRLMD